MKVFGEDYPSMLRAANQVAANLKEIEGAADIKVEEMQGLPAEVGINKAEIARLMETLLRKPRRISE